VKHPSGSCSPVVRAPFVVRAAWFSEVDAPDGLCDPFVFSHWRALAAPSAGVWRSPQVVGVKWGTLRVLRLPFARAPRQEASGVTHRPGCGSGGGARATFNWVERRTLRVVRHPCGRVPPIVARATHPPGRGAPQHREAHGATHPAGCAARACGCAVRSGVWWFSLLFMRGIICRTLRTARVFSGASDAPSAA